MNSTSSGTFRRLEPGLEPSPGRNRRPVRHGWSGWTQLHFRWLEEQKFAPAVQQVVFQEYVDAVMEVRNRVASLEARMRQALAAQERLCARYQDLYHSGKAKGQVTTAVARELVGFIWAVACER